MYNAGVKENARLLRLMGIDVWRSRDPAGSTTPARVLETESLPAPISARTVRKPLLEAESEPAAPSAARTLKIPSAPSVDAVEPFSVVCLTDSGALLLAETPEARFPLRFCSDLLRALGGGGAPQQVVFSWPQPGIEPGTGHAGRSLAAFIDKQLGDSPAARLLVCSRMRERVPDLQWPDRTLMMPSLDVLLLEAELKKALWIQIRRVAAEGTRAPHSAS